MSGFGDCLAPMLLRLGSGAEGETRQPQAWRPLPEKLINHKNTVSIVIVLLITAEVTFGQGIVTGSISGIVLDPQGAVVPGADVRATQMETDRVFATTSSNGGVLQLSSLPPGTYRVTVEYESIMTEQCRAAARSGIQYIAFGDLFLRDIRE